MGLWTYLHAYGFAHLLACIGICGRTRMRMSESPTQSHTLITLETLRTRRALYNPNTPHMPLVEMSAERVHACLQATSAATTYMAAGGDLTFASVNYLRSYW